MQGSLRPPNAEIKLRKPTNHTTYNLSPIKSNKVNEKEEIEDNISTQSVEAFNEIIDPDIINNILMLDNLTTDN